MDSSPFLARQSAHDTSLDARTDSNSGGPEISPMSTSGNSQWSDNHFGYQSVRHAHVSLFRDPEEGNVEEAISLGRQNETGSEDVSETSERPRDSADLSESSQQMKSKTRSPVSWWWWWEIGATVLSSTSLVLLFILLSKSDGLRLQSWKLPIQPNSLIAVLTTVAKTSIMVPVAACLSQLKWSHFMSRPSPLNQFQVIDDASRGPWGSFLLLISGFRIRALVPIALAFVTIVGLGFEPSAQQILDFPERLAPLANVSAEVGIATDYLSKAFVPGNTVWKLIPTADLFHLQSSIIDGMSGSVFEPYFKCPSDYCTWETFTTLGICSAYQNLTSEIKMDCDDPDKPLFNCTYTFPDGKGSTVARNVTFGDLGKSQYLRVESFRSWFDTTAVQNRSGVLSAVKVTNYDLYRNKVPNIGFAYPEPPVTESYFTRFYWCAQTFRNVTAIPRQLSIGSVDVEELGEKEYHIGDGCSCTTLSSPSTGTNYTVDSTLAMYLMDYLSFILTQAVINVAPYSPRLDAPVDLANYLYTTDFQNFTVNLATTLTNQIRSTDPGDNKNATIRRGTAYSKETYIHVRWPWAILPTATIIITSVLLATAILLTRKHPLFKSSGLALLFHGLEDNWPEVHVDQLETAEKVESVAKSMKAQFISCDTDPLLKFRRGT